VSPAPRGPRLTLARLGRIVAWVALAAALARPRVPGERVGPVHVALAVVGCLAVAYAIGAARAARRADTTPGRLFALAGLALWLALLLGAVGLARGEPAIGRATPLMAGLLVAVLVALAAGLIAWGIEVARAWRAHRHGRPAPIFTPPPPPCEEGDGAGPS
jgi:hypothetical protein